MSPADASQRLHVFLIGAVGLGSRTALTALLPPLALWKHNPNVHKLNFSHSNAANVLQYPSSPAGRRGWTAGAHGRASPAAGSGWPTGLVGLAVKEDLELTHSPQGHKHTQPPHGEADQGQLPGRLQKQNRRKHTALSPRGSESNHGKHPDTGNNRTGRDWEGLGEMGRHWETMRETGTFRAATCKETMSPFTQMSVKATLKRIQSSLAKKVSAI